MSVSENARWFVQRLTHPHETLGKTAFSAHYGILSRVSTLGDSPGKVWIEFDKVADELHFEQANDEPNPMFWSGILYATILGLFYLVGALPLFATPESVITAAQNSQLAHVAVAVILTYQVTMWLACAYGVFTLGVFVEGEEVW